MNLAALLLVLGAAFQDGEPVGPPPNGESLALLHGLARARALEFTVPEGPARAAAELLARRVTAGRELAARVLAEGARRDPEAVRALVGTSDDAELAALVGAAGVEPFAGGFRAFGRSYEAPGDAAVLTFEDPAQAGRPLVLYFGNDRSQLAAYLDHVPRLSRPYLALYADGELALTCPLALDGTPRSELARDFLARREQYFAAGPRRTLETLTFSVHGEPDEEQWKSYSKGLAGVRSRVLQWLALAPDAQAPAVEVFLYEHPEDFAWCLDSSELSLVNRLRPRAHVLLAPGLPDDGGQALARVLARELAGAPEAPWMAEGLAVAAASEWWGRSLTDWIGHLVLGRTLPDLRELLLPSADMELSPHVLQPARGFLFQLLVQGTKGDARALRALWKGADLQPKRLSVAYQKAVIQAAKGLGKEWGPRATQILHQRLLTAPVRHGLALVEGPDAGYGSRVAGAALDEAMAIGQGPDSVSLSLSASARDPRAPLLSARPAPLHASVSDVDLAAAVASAKGRGARVLLALEPLVEPSGSWADSVANLRPAEMAEFFECVGRIGLHYALLSELLGIEILSCAANLREGARTEQRAKVLDPRRLKGLQNGWKILLARLRGAYRGGLTYSARFPGEAEVIGFFGDLDFVSLALFPRSSAQDVPSDAELRRMIRFELERALDLAVRWNKPLLVTQIGFPARAESFGRPWVPRGEADVAAQQRYLEALAEVLGGKLENGAALRGFYLWNWPLDDARARPEDDGFSLRGKPLDEALTRLFAR